MRTFIYSLVLVTGVFIGASVSAEDNHDHDDEHLEEASPLVGPDKGITERSNKGFKLSAEAMKSFAIEMMDLSSATVEIEKKSLLTIKEEKFIYRVRENWIVKIPVQVLNQNRDKIKLSLSSFAPGDKMITRGVGFIRTSELLLEQGASHGHSH